MDAVDKFYRMYLRSRGLPERMTSSTMEHKLPNPVPYGEIEDKKPVVKTPEEARKLAEAKEAEEA